MNAMLLRSLENTLPRFGYRFGDEAGLHNALATVLEQQGFTFEREYAASARDRFDFLIGGSVVIEAKVKGSLAPALRQAARYAEHEYVSAVLIVATRLWASYEAPAPDSMFNGKPVRMLRIGGISF